MRDKVKKMKIDDLKSGVSVGDELDDFFNIPHKNLKYTVKYIGKKIMVLEDSEGNELSINMEMATRDYDVEKIKK